MEAELERLHARLASAQANSKQAVNRGNKTPQSLVELYSTVLDELERTDKIQILIRVLKPTLAIVCN